MKIRATDEGKPLPRQRRPSVDNLLSDENTSEDEGALSDNDLSKAETKRGSEEEVNLGKLLCSFFQLL